MSRADQVTTAPLSYYQEHLWVAEQLTPGSVAYHTGKAFRIAGDLDVECLRHAFTSLLARHEALRMRVVVSGGRPAQHIAPEWVLPWSRADAGSADPEAAISRYIRELVHRPFDQDELLVRLGLLRLAPRDHLLVVVLHHLVTDGWSERVLFTELAELYAARRAGRAPAVVPHPVQYREIGACRRDAEFERSVAADMVYWRDLFAEPVAPLTLPLGRDPASVLSGHSAVVPLDLPPAIVRELTAVAREARATVFMALLAVYGCVLAAAAGVRDLVVCVPMADRSEPEHASVVGLLLNIVPIRLDLSANPSFVELLGHVRDRVLDAHTHAVPFSRMVAELTPGTGNALARVMITLGVPGADVLALAGAEVTAVDVPTETAHFDLAWVLTHRSDGGISSQLRFRTELLDRNDVALLAARARHVITQVLARPADPRAAHDTTTPAERSLLVRGWAHGPAALSSELAHEVIRRQALHAPHRTAVVVAGETFTYAAVLARAERIRAVLHARGVGRGSVVALLLPRDAHLVPSVLAVWRAGAAYVPLDPTHPAEFVADILADTGASVVLTVASLVLPDVPAEFVALDTLGADGVEPPLPLVPVHPADAAYVIYTSGSTGAPKGVVVEHGNLRDYLHWAATSYVDGTSAVTPVHTPITADLTVTALLVPLYAGGVVRLLDPAGAEHGLDAVAELLDLLCQPVDLGLLKVTPAHLTLLDLMAGRRADPFPARVRTVVIGGELLAPEVVTRWRALLQDARFVNEYGPTEATVGCCVFDATAPSTQDSVPVGTPIDGAEVYVLDAELTPAPPLSVGELYVGGGGVARGYLGQPGRTADRFVPNPFGARPGGRLYRTGDLARWLPGGTLEYMGRADQQVKIRGHRVEPAHVEAVLLRHAAVGAAAVVPFRDASGSLALAAHVVVAPEHRGSALLTELREFVAHRLPAHLVPSAWSVLDDLPLTATGKVDRNALPHNTAARPGRAAGGTWSSTGRAIAEVWRDLLGVPAVGLGDSFTGLGGHSVLAVHAALRLSDVLGVRVPAQEMLTAPDLATFATSVETLGRDGADATVNVPLADDVTRDATPAARRLWFLWRLAPTSAAYNVTRCYELRGALDETALAGAVDAVVAHNPGLRSRFEQLGDDLVQVVDEPPTDVLARAEASAETVAEMARQRANEPFDLSSGPVFRAHLWRVTDEHRVLLLVVHHIVFDQGSLAILEDQLARCYASGDVGSLPAGTSWRPRPVTGADLDYWRRRLDGAVATELPADHPRADTPGKPGAYHLTELPAVVTERIATLARELRVTRFTVLVAAYAVWLCRQTGAADVTFGVPVSGRDDAGTRDAIGFFVNTLPVRLAPSPDETFRGFVLRAQGDLAGDLAHQHVPFDEVVGVAGADRAVSRNPLFQTMFAYSAAGETGSGPALSGVHVRVLPPLTRAAAFDLTVAAEEHPGGTRFWFEYDTGLFEPDTVTALADGLVDVLAGVTRTPDQLVAPSLLASDREVDRLTAWNATDRPTSLVPVHELFREQARRAPDRLAIDAGPLRLTYAEVDARSDRLAARLLPLARPGQLVALCVPGDASAVLGVLATWKAGAAFVPVDPDQPIERLHTILETAEPAAVVVADDRAARLIRGLRPGRPVVVLDDVTGPDVPPRCETDPRQLAYVIFTSGSTGRPKAVMIDHRGLLNHLAHQVLQWHARAEADRGRPLRVALTAPFAFDVFLNQLAALVAGHTLVVPTDEQRLDPRVLCALGESSTHALDVIDCATAQLRVLVDAGLLDLPHPPALVIFGGEPCASGLWSALRAHPGTTAHNVYGATECSVETTCAPVTETPTPTVGRPAANTTVHVLDEDLRPAPIGAIGEICIGGDGVGLGYLRQPGATASVFVPDPFSRLPGRRLYRTGDLGRLRGDGRLEFHGRRDGQVKIAGQRVELAEIETALAAAPGVRQAAVVLDRTQGGAGRLVAYVTRHGDDGATPESWRAFLGDRLLAHMVPAEFVVLDDLPLTGNGKLDRARLAALAPRTSRAADAVAPRTPAEEAVAGVWRAVLGAAGVSVTDDFFAAGGNSLLAIQVARLLSDASGVEVPVRLVLTRPTVEGQAAALAGHVAGGDSAAALIPLSEGDGRPAVVLVHPIGGTAFCYRPLAEELRGGHTVLGLHREPGGAPPPADWTALARDYADLVVARFAGNPVALAGWSVGGVLAHALACELQSRGAPVSALTLLDAFPPAAGAPADAADLCLLAGLRAAAETGTLRQMLAEPEVDRLLASFGTSGAALGGIDDDTVATMVTGWHAMLRGLTRHRLGRFAGPVRLVLAAAHSRADVTRAVDGWTAAASGTVSVRTVAGDHFTVLDRPAVAATAAAGVWTARPVAGEGG
jgi:amino acid adenylation domain-containing protein